MHLFSGSSNQPLTAAIARHMGVKLGGCEHERFPNGECRVRIKESVEGDTCVVVQSFSDPVNDHIIEFLLIVDALYRLGARRILAVIPWIGYSPQDKVFRPGEPLSAKVIGSIVSGSLVERVFTFDLHNESIAGFFSKPLESLSCDRLFIQYLQKHLDLKQALVVCPDLGAIKRSRAFSERLSLPYAVVDKERNRRTGAVRIHGISAPVRAKNCLIFDDFISTGQTAIMVADFLKQHGARRVWFNATHHFNIAGVSEALEKSEIDLVVTTDTIRQRANAYPKIKVLSTAGTIVQTLAKWI